MRNSINIKINGQLVEVERGTILLHAILKQGIFVPTLCFIKEANPYFSCRICMVFEEKSQKYIPACSTKVNDEMLIITHNNNIIKHRQLLLELLLANHPDDCLYCVKNEACNLRKLTECFHIQQRSFYKKDVVYSVDKSSHSIVLDYSKCIQCGNCVYVCNKVQECKVFQLNYKGIHLKVEPEFGKMLNQSQCVLCGECLKNCPTATIYEKENLNAFIQNISEGGGVLISPLLEFDSKTSQKNLRAKENKQIGFFRNFGKTKLFLLNAGVDLFLYELYKEFKLYLSHKQTLVSSFCPSIIMYFNKNIVENIKLSNTEIPSILVSKLLKKHSANNSFTLHEFSACIALKQSLHLKNMDDKHIAYTSRELQKIKRYFSFTDKQLKDGYDEPLHLYSSLSYLPFLPGGTAEALARMYIIENTGKEIQAEFSMLFRQEKEYFEVSIDVLDKKIVFGIINGMGNIRKALQSWKDKMPHFIDVLACPNGCYTSGGMSFENDKEWKNFKKHWHDLADKCTIRSPLNNKYLLHLYETLNNNNE